MTRTLLTGNAAAAWAARLADVDYIPAFPITPQTEIVELLSSWVARGEIPAHMTTLESEHSMLTAAGAAALTGARVFSATSSQGLLYGLEMLYTVAGWRVPLVLVNVSRGLAAPITLEPDHNDLLATRDSGFLLLQCATCQEVLDAILVGYRLAEDPRVRLPVLVNLDGFYLSFTREPVDLPAAEDVARFLGRGEPPAPALDARHPQSMAVSVLGGSTYSYFRYQTHLAALGAEAVLEEAADAYAEVVGRRLRAVATEHMAGAEVALLMMGSFATKAAHAVERMRAAGWPVGLVRPVLLRPFPGQALRDALRGVRAVAVVDQNLSTGLGGVLHTELASALYGLGPDAPRLLSYVGGLGGRDLSDGDFFRMAREAMTAAETGQTPPPRLLYTADELEQMRALQAVAAGAAELRAIGAWSPVEAHGDESEASP